jgi:hypothetical protein
MVVPLPLQVGHVVSLALHFLQYSSAILDSSQNLISIQRSAPYLTPLSGLSVMEL